MTALDLAGQLAAIGGEQVAMAAGWTLLAIGAVAGVAWSLWHIARWTRETMRAYPHRYEAPALPAAVPCPVCAVDPWSPDCTCREDCGDARCQAAEPPGCPWCDTHACIDRTKCNCGEACGSWLCEAREESRG